MKRPDEVTYKRLLKQQRRLRDEEQFIVAPKTRFACDKCDRSVTARIIWRNPTITHHCRGLPTSPEREMIAICEETP